jgi:hypothetical protein
VAKRKRKKRSWIKTLLRYILIPIAIWFIAFLIWFYWSHVVGLFSTGAEKPNAVPKATRRDEKSEAAPDKRGAEKILDEDRKKLEDILRRR